MTFDDRFDTESQFHLDMQIQKNIQSGMSPDEARRAALVQFGGRERYREDARDETRSRAWEDVGRDLRASLRTMRRHPAFSVATIATMALGIAATASIFSITDAFLFRALPFKDSDRIVMIGDVQGANTWYPASYLEFTDWRSMTRDASAVVATIGSGMTWAASDGAERIRAARVSDGYFDLLGVRPIMGRTFVRDDHAEGAARVVVLSRAFWTERFSASRDAIGKQLTLNRNSYTIVGIVESGLELGSERTMLWTPLEPYAPWKDRGTHYLTVLGRMRDGATLASLGRDFDDIARRIRDDPANQTTHAVVVGGLRERIVGETRKPMLMLLASVGLLLLISIANVAGLLQARVASRATELAVRAALGASRRRLIRQIVTESVALAVVGGAVGVVLSVWVIKGLVWLWPATVPRPVDFQVDGRVIGVALLLSTIGALVAALLTAAARRGAVSLSDRATGGIGSSRQMRGFLVAAEVAVTVLLLVGAGLTMESLRRSLAVDMGFTTEQLLTARIPVPGDSTRLRAFYDEALERIGALPGVQEVAGAADLPLSGGGMNGDFSIQGREFAPDSAPMAEQFIVTPDYMATMGIRVLQGRAFDSRDAAGAPLVAVINEAMARRHWPNANPIGQRIRVRGDSTQWQEIVGVVADTKTYTVEDRPLSGVYLPFQQWPVSLTIVVRTTTPAATENALRSIVRSMDPMIPVTSQPYERIIYRATHGRRVPAVLLSSFALLALILSGVGLYGLLAYAVQQRRHEMGVRMAIGAQREDVVRLVMGEGIRLSAVGALVGLGAAFAAARTVASLLFGVKATDPIVYTLAALVVVVVACVASAVPAMRASRVDPVAALRSD